ncbi:monovalent cation:proton antiporter-2 (CPA2) family protein [Kaistia terrae]|uniref:Monovalent cation:proton antiporter-2 (CPA2) family protein n=1 Tax=Kaistia terrae TaxID=537017 RepID=A0ABW0PV04_9HYPH|nr:monovalent cation:proton antiporter-2 (CPA2) family protein [Kaistia terrae]MCX5579528.1 monovalent cation:proton antiporter-2 (CPA2) family protein [Kaistia terrae]
MSVDTQGTDLVQLVALLGAAVIAVPISKRLGLGTVLGYLAAGLAIGPYGLKLFTDPQSILHVAELGVVLFLFIIGLEMRPSRLWSLRGEIFGLGVAQVVACGALLTGLGVVAGFPPTVAFIAGMGFVLSSTAIVMQILEERGDTATPAGQRVISILLLEDLAIVPLLAAVALLGSHGAAADGPSRWMSIVIAIGSLAALIAAGRWLLNPMFRVLASVQAREVMTAAALLVVFGAALAMQIGGLSMAMGAFLAGVLLSESSFRHQLEADIEPFRGILLGLFFLSVGMSLDLGVIARHWQTIAFAVVAYMVLKSAGIYVIARLLKADHAEALTRAVLLAQGGEFAFVLYAAATASGIFTGEVNAMLTATVIISMVLTPLGMLALKWVLPKPTPEQLEEDFNGAGGRVLMIGFGRFGQISAQFLLAEGVDVTAIDSDAEMIRAASRFGFKVYFGDGTRLDVLRAAGIENSQIVAICTDKPEVTDKIVELIQSEFPFVQLYVRSYDRGHTLRLLKKGVNYQMRETLESAFTFGAAALDGLGVAPERIADIAENLRTRDAARLAAQQAGGLLSAGRDLFVTQAIKPEPEPLTVPKRESRTLNKEAEPAKAEPVE